MSDLPKQFEKETGLKAHEDIEGNYDNDYIGAFATESYIEWLQSQNQKLRELLENLMDKVESFDECHCFAQDEVIEIQNYLKDTDND